MKHTNLIQIIADKAGAILVGTLFVVSFLLAPLLISHHFCGNNHALFFTVFAPLLVAVGLFWVRLARWHKWPADKYTKTSKK